MPSVCPTLAVFSAEALKYAPDRALGGAIARGLAQLSSVVVAEIDASPVAAEIAAALLTMVQSPPAAAMETGASAGASIDAQTDAAASIERLFLIGTHVGHIEAAAAVQRTLGAKIEVIPLILRAGAIYDAWPADKGAGPGPEEVADEGDVDRPGFSLLISRLAEVVPLLTTPRLDTSLALILVALDESATIAAAMADAARFLRLYAAAGQVVVVDDGSSDDTAARARAWAAEHQDLIDVVIVEHKRNLGMGASMRDGFAAARSAWVMPLPADRQVRAANFADCLPHLADAVARGDERLVILGYYDAPHAGFARQIMSIVFRLLVRYLGQYRVDFAGGYIVPRHLLSAIDGGRTTSDTFLYSFQLLEELRRLGCHFARELVRPHPRQVGHSRVANWRRIGKLTRELAVARISSLRSPARARV